MFLVQAIPHPQISWICKNAFLHGYSLEGKKENNRYVQQWGMKKEALIHLYNGIICSHKIHDDNVKNI